MGMTIWRWAALVSAACGAIAFAVLPFPAVTPRAWASTDPAPVVNEFAKLADDAARAHGAVREYRAAQALDRWNVAARGRDTTLIRIDSSVPANVSPTIRSIVAEQWQTLGTPPSAAHAEVFVYMDSTSIKRTGDTTAARRVLEPRRFVEVVYALPRATDGNRCVVLVRLRGSSAAHVNALRSQSVLGTCAFFAAFGTPGAAMESWLTATGFRFARQSDWYVARPPATDASSIYSLSAAAGECLTGAPSRCGDALFDKPQTLPVKGRLASVLDPAMPSDATGIRARPAPLGGAEGALLADAARSLGSERFRRFWQDSATPSDAFRAASGAELDQWTQQWLARTYGAVASRPRARARDALWLAVVAPLLLVLAARPRQLVLSDRLFPARS